MVATEDVDGDAPTDDVVLRLLGERRRPSQGRSHPRLVARLGTRGVFGALDEAHDLLRQVGVEVALGRVGKVEGGEVAEGVLDGERWERCPQAASDLEGDAASASGIKVQSLGMVGDVGGRRNRG